MLGIAPATMAEPVPQDGAPALVPRSTLSNSP
jgi:hypothetical protein